MALYGLTYTVSEMISGAMDMTHLITAIAMTLYTAALILWLYRTGLHRPVGLRPVRNLRQGEYLYLLPLILLPLFNLVTATEYRFEPFEMLLMLSVSVTEEIFFRGFLLRCFVRRSVLTGALINGALFATAHCVNLLNGGDISYTLMQLLCAFAVGICCFAITVKFKSLFPCILLHFLVNITANGETQSTWLEWKTWGLLLCTAVYALYGIWLCRKIRLFHEENPL